MSEEISLREMIEIMMKQKWIIVIVTLTCVLVSTFVNFFVLKPTYETFSIVRLESANQDKTTSSTDIRQYQEALKSSSTLNSLIEKNELNRDEYTINSIRNMFKLETVDNSNILKIVVRGNDAEKISRMSNMLAYELGIRIEISDRMKEVVESQAKLETLMEQIEVVKAQIIESEKLLGDTPEKIFTTQSVSENELLRDIIQERTNLNAIDSAKLQMQTESINPIYTELQAKIANLRVQLHAIETEAKNYQEKVTSNLSRIDELETKSYNDKLNINKSIRIMDGTNAIFINPSIQPESPVGPKKLMNIVIAAVIGASLSIFIVFIRHYMNVKPRSVVDV